jgi:outer membrane protein assembly factor BamB
MKFPSLNKKTGLVFAAALTILSTIGCGGRSENVTPAADVKVSTVPVAAANSASRIPEGILKGKGLEEVWYLGKVVSGNEEVGLQRAYLLDEDIFCVTESNSSSLKHLIRFSRQSGHAVWYEDLKGTINHAPTTYHYPATLLRDPELYYTQLDKVICLDLDTGRKKWERELSFPVSTPVAANESHIFLGSDLKRAYAVPKNLKVEDWTYLTKGRIEARPLLAGDKVVFASHDGSVTGLIPSVGWDKVRSWKFNTGDRIRSDLAFHDRYIFVGSADYKVYCLRLDGTVRWSFVAQAAINESPVIYNTSAGLHAFAIADENKLKGLPRTLYSLPLPKGDNVAAVFSSWTMENVKKVVSIGKKNLYVLLEPGSSRQKVVVAVDIATGKEAFRLDVAGFNFIPNNLAGNGRIFLISRTGAIQVLGEKSL